ncbi:MAG: D-alanyl-D-alanine carboxypeptidase/D-alanyl-D-alanine endopeptidase [Chitinophagaceae bacterium]
MHQLKQKSCSKRPAIVCKRTFILLFILSFFVPQISQAQSLQDRIRQAIQQFTSDTQMRHAMASITVLNANTGEEIYELNNTVGLAPASCQKTITSATAFYLLGKDFRYHTKLYYSGKIQDHILQGDIIIVGSGDPMLGTWRYPDTKMEVILNEWMEAIKKAGIHKIDGNIIGDADAFDSQMPPDGWIWQDMGNYYGAGPSALTWHENQYDLHLLPGDRTGSPVKILKVDPPLFDMHFINELKTGKPGSGDQTYIYNAPYSHFAYLRGTSPVDDKNFTVSGSVPDPALFCAFSLQQALGKKGMIASQKATTTRIMRLENKKLSHERIQIDDHISPTLDSISYWFLHRSINLYGEQLIKTIALHENTTVCTDTGVAILKRFWEQKGIDPGALNMFDGSGLSPENRVTTKAMAQVLYSVKQAPWYQTYFDCLPVIHNIRMKSGHINDVCSYAGFLTTGDGTPVIFSFIVNNYNGSTGEVQNKMFRVLDEIKK